MKIFYPNRFYPKRASPGAGIKPVGIKPLPPGVAGSVVKDNVASVLLVGMHQKLRIYGTCRLSEQLPNPMHLETVTREGCVDLKRPC